MVHDVASSDRYGMPSPFTVGGRIGLDKAVHDHSLQNLNAVKWWQPDNPIPNSGNGNGGNPPPTPQGKVAVILQVEVHLDYHQEQEVLQCLIHLVHPGMVVVELLAEAEPVEVEAEPGGMECWWWRWWKPCKST